jgi:predicted nucleic acid-binding protein
MLDATPLGKLARRKPKAEDYARLRALTDANVEVMIPEIADYEIRRSFLLHNLHESLRQLDRLNEELIYVPLTTSTMRRAASMWADARRAGRPTAADQALDCDVILAAQALEMGAQVITENAAHLSRYGPALSWTDLPPRA